jgi:HK97 gp10 family phage protein
MADETIKGIENLQAAIDKLGKIDKEWAAEALRRVQSYTPVLTGDLRDSWKCTVKDGVITIENTAVDKEGNYYGSFVEFGTVHQRGQFFTTRTLAEGEQIWQVAKQKVGL